ncbi:MAG: hypothetical protein CMG77_04705 [Marinimicrobium sp.]|uniref:putative holin n=2 Tax=Marinimicrobium TaxID=359337 RepID=UPI000C60EFFB|nr:hypothetical protein [Marinimicrobium sp.]
MYGFPGVEPTRRPRLLGWMIATLVVFLLIALLAPHQLPVVAYKSAMVMLGAVLGYWIDRALFPYARPHILAHTSPEIDRNAHWARSMAMLRRAVIVLACVLGLTLGL